MGTDAPDGVPQTVRFHYIKSPFFHTIHCDGVIGGPTPNGGLHIAFFAERVAIPTSSEHRVTPEGDLGEEVSRTVREGIVREMGVDVVMAFHIAEKLHEWLGEHLERLGKLREEARRRSESKQEKK